MQTNAQPCRVIMHPAAGNSHIAIAAMQATTGRIAARLTGKKSRTIYLLTPQEAARYQRAPQGGAA
ncbi:hypothetical protein [Vreelandella venusta]|uniref:Uncharacterized protein n=1 Tax=Vreelandella venusta TaxID=44935 RepID=A0ABX2BC27_9GAMM|nr:hypothetical protein [Halomonas venusta]AZM96094.1 hypothetical protein EI420_10545 [Halomonas venusta]NPT30614.1 hypothetical protein [Halomonas venusta]